VLGDVVRRAADDPNEDSKARGLTGRVNKQVYVDARGRPSDLARAALFQAITCYREVYDKDPHKNLWHGVNVLALMHRARADGITVTGLSDSGALANAIIEAVRNPQGRTVGAITDLRRKPALLSGTGMPRPIGSSNMLQTSQPIVLLSPARCGS
jgi:hypothetical protein